jgi:hypothetical protein
VSPDSVGLVMILASVTDFFVVLCFVQFIYRISSTCRLL